jgi:aminopeptidase-like protein
MQTMSATISLKALLAEILPLHRTLVSDGTDRALEIIGRHMPPEAGYAVETYAPGTPVWTWRVPERYVVQEAYLESQDGARVVDFADNPLHLVSYSLPVDAWLTWEQLEPHLHCSAKRPQAIPWEFKYYDRSWGFCLSKEVFDRLPRDRRYHAVIRSEFVSDPRQGLRLGVAQVHPQGGPVPQAGEMLIIAHICHPAQANDAAAGVVSAIGVAQRLAARPLPPGSMSARFLFCPETIGSITYLSQHEDLITRLPGGIFLEMTGNRNSLVLQRSRQDDHRLDRVARCVLRKRAEGFREGEFAQVIANDERVINGPGVNVPCLSLSRWPYDEYHTSDDNLEIVHEDMLQQAAEVAEEICRIYAADYIPRRAFRGPVFLSGYGLWVDWRVNWALNRAIEKIMMRFEGRHSVFEIADELGLDYWETREYVEKFRVRDLVRAEPLPVEGEEQ